MVWWLLFLRPVSAGLFVLASGVFWGAGTGQQMLCSCSTSGMLGGAWLVAGGFLSVIFDCILVNYYCNLCHNVF